MVRARLSAPKSAGHGPLHRAAEGVRHGIGRSTGQPLDGAQRSRMEARIGGSFGSVSVGTSSGFHGLEAEAEAAASGARESSGAAADFSHVRLHSDGYAAAAARQLGASAFTFGEHIYADPARIPSGAAERDGLVAHELAHVVQQRMLGWKRIQPRLIVSGDPAHIQRFLTFAETYMGEDLTRNVLTGAVTATSSINSPRRSPAFAAAMHRIMDDGTHDALAHIGTGQAGVVVGAFPERQRPPIAPRTSPAPFHENDLLTGNTEQQIDIDDIEAIEAGAPGSGAVTLIHELTENFEAHATPPVAGMDRYPSSHAAATITENSVALETVGPGGRVAQASLPLVNNKTTVAVDFEHYFLVFNVTIDRSNGNASLSAARRAPRVNVLRRTIDHYSPRSSTFPTTPSFTGALSIGDVIAAAGAHPLATVRIEGFTDNVEMPAPSSSLGAARADGIKQALVRGGIDEPRMHATSGSPAITAAANTTEAGRALNRRVVIVVDRPGP